MPTFALNFSRPGGQVIAQYYLLLRHGHAGDRDIDQACAGDARYIAERLPRTGPFQLLYDGQGALPAVCYTLADTSAPFTLDDLTDRLRTRGWQVPAYPLPPAGRTRPCSESSIRHGFSRDMARLLVGDIERSVAALSNGPRTPQPAFHHT